jgi:predicted Zn-dependent protease
MFHSHSSEDLQPALPLTKEARQIFFQLGTTALNNLLGTHAAALFGALEKAEPDQAYAKLGLGMSYMCVSDFDTAARYFNDDVVQSNSALAPSANVLLAMNCKLDNNNSGFEAAAAKAVQGNNEMQSTIEDLKVVSV